MSIYNEVKFGKEAQDEIYEGAKIVGRAVASSLGPNGKTALIEGFGGNSYIITKDGVSIAKAVGKLKNRYQNIGGNLIKNIANESAKVADGTTTSSVLGLALLENGRKYLTSGVKPADLKKGIECATKLAIEKIKEKSKDIRNETDILNIATIASNNDEKIGKLVSEAYSQIGEDGILTVEDSPKTETYLEFVEGMQFNNGYESQYFVNNTDRMTCEFKNPYILITDEEINNLNVLGKILNQIANEGRSLLIIANGYGGQTMPALVFNAVNKTLQVCAVKGPEFGEMRKEILTDIAILTGGSFISESLGKSLSKMEMSDLGSAEKVVVSKDNTLIVGGKCDKSSLDERIEHIKSEMSIETVEKKKENMKKRIASLSGGICVLRVYADNETEMKELKDRIEDTIGSVKASVKEGIVLGGGVTLLKVSSELEPPKELTDSQICGFNIVKDALEAPIRQLAKNSDVSDDVIVEKTLAQSDGEKSGYNFATMEWDENLFDKVVDPTLVETSALKNASSFIGLYLNTNVVITTVNEDEGKECNCGR